MSVQLDTYSPMWYTFTNILWKVNWDFCKDAAVFCRVCLSKCGKQYRLCDSTNLKQCLMKCLHELSMDHLMFIFLVCCKPHISCTRVWNMCDHIPFYLQIYIGFCYTSTCIDSASEYVVLLHIPLCEPYKLKSLQIVV